MTAHGEAATDDEQTDEEQTGAEPVPERRFMAVIRFGPGVSIVPGQEEAARVVVDVGLAGRLDVTRGRAWLSIVPEAGYTFHAGDLVGGHYGTIGLGFRFGTNWIAANPMASVVLGSRADRFDLGVRAGLRLLGALDLLALEVAYEYRTLRDDSEPLQGVRIVLLFDLGVVFMPTLLTRFGYSFGRAE